MRPPRISEACKDMSHPCRLGLNEQVAIYTRGNNMTYLASKSSTRVVSLFHYNNEAILKVICGSIYSLSVLNQGEKRQECIVVFPIAISLG